MKKVTKKLQSFIDSISVRGKSTIPGDDADVYYSKIDGSYLTRVGCEDHLSFLLNLGVTEEIQDGYGDPKSSCIGFNPKEQKWYGWSHRAIFGFGIGSECKIGSCGYNADNKEAFRDKYLNFWGNDEYSIGDDAAVFTDEGVLITYTYNDKVPNKSMRGTVFSHFAPFPKKWGKGEWTATTLEEAKQMAIDFAEGVS